MILNRGPHGPPGGNLQVLGRNTEHLGNWGGMDPFAGNQQIAINSPGCSSGWRIVAASPVFVDVTLRPEGSSALPQDTVPCQNGHWAYEGQHFWLRGIPTSDKNGNACITGTTNFKISFKIWLLMHMTAYTGKVPWRSSATARGWGWGWGGVGWGGVVGNDKLAIDKGGNLPEKVENHWSNSM